jgi:hypothetical protein
MTHPDGHIVKAGPDGHTARMQPRAIAALAYAAGWRDAKDLLIAVAVAHAECGGFYLSYNDNLDDATNEPVSRDVGLFQINIPARLIGTPAEKALLDPAQNVANAYTLWKTRGWQPWASYNSGVVFDDTYLSMALLGVLNFLAEQEVAQGAKAHPERAVHHTLKAPVVSLAQWKRLHRDVPIW